MSKIFKLIRMYVFNYIFYVVVKIMKMKLKIKKAEQIKYARKYKK